MSVMTSSAPASRAISAFSSVETTAMTRASMLLASWMLATPMPPAAPWTSTVSPARRPPRRTSAKSTVR